MGEARPDEARPESRVYDVSPPPAQLTLPAGTWVTVRVNEPLASDRNQQGDAFTATLAQPLVAEGRVVARRGQMVAGRVTEALKGGRVKGTSRLGLELTELSLVDGRQIPVHTGLIERRADTSIGRDAAAVGAATGVGAAIGGVADGGFGAGMGAIAGAAASTIGVLVTRGNQTVVEPETPLTFRLEEPLTISTERAAEAFLPPTQETYESRYQRPVLQRRPPPPVYYGGYPFGYYPPFYYGPSVVFFSGPRYYGRGPYRRW